MLNNPLSSVSWSRYSQLTYAFATTTLDVNVLFLPDSNENFRPGSKLVTAADQNVRRPLIFLFLIVPGLISTLIRMFWPQQAARQASSTIGSAANRTAFVNAPGWSGFRVRPLALTS
ncbi:hypothetical protein C8J56DRAFT_861650 [Mycena floridula]|nr:hypothetical protein C8J56DRAFT_861650 [Mycena floridula]